MSQNQGPGLVCPECGHLISVSMTMLLNQRNIYCTGCGLELKIDQEDSKQGLEHLRKLHDAMQAAEEAKKNPYE